MSRTDSPAYLAQLLRDYATLGAAPVLKAKLDHLADRIERIPAPAPEVIVETSATKTLTLAA